MQRLVPGRVGIGALTVAAAAVVVLALVATQDTGTTASTAGAAPPLAAERPGPSPSPTPSPSPSPIPSPSPVPPPDPNPHVGTSGAEVTQIQTQLTALHYMVGAVDGQFGSGTRDGLIAFQKVESLTRSGEADPATLARLAGATIPAPAYATPADHLELDIAHQVIYVVRAGVVSAILPTSTGSGRTYTEKGYSKPEKAITPNGAFSVYWKVNGWHQAPLGDLYKPSFFNGGIAFHGYPSVPTYPASHGCSRIPMEFADWFYANAAPYGETVYVYGGPTGPNPDPVQQTSTATEAPPTALNDNATSPSPSPSPSPSAPGLLNLLAPSPSPSPSPSPLPSPTPSLSPPPTASPLPSPTPS